jgi:heme-degrading monooxygenase HmoA
MVTIGMNYRVLPGKEQAFENMFRAVLATMNDMPGHTGSSLFRDVNDPQKYLILSDWNDRDAFDAFIASDKFRGVANWGKEQVLAGRPTHEYYER